MNRSLRTCDGTGGVRPRALLRRGQRARKVAGAVKCKTDAGSGDSSDAGGLQRFLFSLYFSSFFFIAGALLLAPAMKAWEDEACGWAQERETETEPETELETEPETEREEEPLAKYLFFIFFQ